MATLSRADDLRNQNRSRVISVVRKSGAVSRKQIGEITGLSAATISAITADLIEEGVLLPPKPAETSMTGRGRPTVALALNPDAALVCSLYFQLNRVTATLVDYSGETICGFDIKITSENLQARDIKRTLIAAVEGALKKVTSKCSLSRIAVGFQGVTDVSGQTVLWTPVCEERDMPVAHWLRNHFKVPVKVSNDCDMIVQGLHWRHPEMYGDNFAAVLLAHGVGMGLFLRGSSVNGTRSSGIEFGHMAYQPDGALCRCGNRGCIEAYAGDYALSRQANGESEDTPPFTMQNSPGLAQVATAVERGDSRALAALEKAGSALGAGLANLFALVDPFPVVFVGRGAAFLDYFEPHIRKVLEQAPGQNPYEHIEMTGYEHEQPLVRDGCAITALQVQDDELARRRVETDGEKAAFLKAPDGALN